MQHHTTTMESVARALCAKHGGTPDHLHDGRPFWEHYLPDAEVAINASGLLKLIDDIKMLVPKPDNMPGKSFSESTRAKLYLDVQRELYR